MPRKSARFGRWPNTSGSPSRPTSPCGRGIRHDHCQRSLTVDCRTSAIHHQHAMPFGASLQDGRVRFRLWAPAQSAVTLLLDGESLQMNAVADGWHETVTGAAIAGSRYQFVLAEGQHVADPASRCQPDDAPGASEVIDASAYRWSS